MVKLIIRIGIMLLILGIAGIGLIQVMENKTSTYLQASRDKQALLKKRSAPSLILVGGSNVAFGFNSAFIQQALEIPVINMGLHANLGIRYMLSEVKKDISKGDQIVLSPEYDLFFNTIGPSGKILIQAVLANPGTLSLLAIPDDLLTLISHLYVPFKSAYGYYIAGYTNNTIYVKENFNDRGDFIIPSDVRGSLYNKKESRVFRSIDQVNSDAIKIINEFTYFARAQGANVLLTFPPIPESEYEDIQAGVADLVSVLDKELVLNIISKPDDYVFPSVDFHDTKYHLNPAGKKERTRQLVMDIMRVEN